MLRLNKLMLCTAAALLVAGTRLSALAAPAAGEADGEHGEAGGSALLSFDLGSYLWKIIIFTIFLIVLAKFVWPPILKGLQSREEKQRRDLQQAEDAAKKAQQTLDEYKQQLAEAQKEAQRIIEQSRQSAQEVAAQVKAQAEADAQNLRQRNAAEIKAAKEEAIAELYQHTAEIATQVASKIIRKQLSAADQQALVDQSLEELSNVNRN